MARKGIITEKEIISNDALEWGGKYAKAVQEAIDINEKFLQSAKKYHELSKQYKSVDNFSEFKKVKEEEIALSEKNQKLLLAESKTRTQLEREKKAHLDTEKKALELARKKEIQQKRSTKLTIQERVQNQALNKIKRQQAREQLGLVGAYEKLNKKRTEAQTKLSNLLATEKKDIISQKRHQREIDKTRETYNKLNTRVKAIDASTNNYTKNIGNYGSALKGLSGTFRSMVSALGLTTGVYAFFQVMRNGIKVIRDYEKQNATLSGILQVEKKDMQELREDSARLGETTVKTAGEVTQLQIAYARLGFSQQEIIDMTEASIQGSIAMNSELDATATLVGAVVNTFDDLSSTDAPKILDIMSLATAKSALNFQKLETGLPIVSGAANAAGIPFTKLVALLGKLADSGIDVSSSSTALRNIFIESAKQGLNYGQIIQKIKDSQDKLTAANDEFGKRAAVSATVLAQNIEATEELDTALQNAAGTAESMANKELDTLDGSLQLLKSAWQGVILETDDANSASSRLKVGIKFLAKNLKTIISVLTKITGLWLLYKVAVLGGNLAVKAGIALNKLYRLSVIAMNGGIRKTILALKALKVATATSGIGLLLVALGSAYAIWQSFKDGAKDATDGLKEFNKEVERTKLRTSKLKSDIEQYAKGMDQLSIATDAYSRVEDDLQKKLKDEGVNNYLVKESLKLLTSARGQDITELNKQIDYAGSYTDAQKKYIRSAIINAQELRKIINSNTDFILSQEEEKKKKKEEADKKEKARIKKLARDAYNLSRFRLEQEINLYKDIATNEEKSFFERYDAYENLEDAKVKLAELTRDFLLRGVKKGSDEELLILEQHATKVKEIYKEISDDVKDLTEDLTISLDTDEAENDIHILRGAIKSFAKTLGVDSEEALKQYEEAVIKHLATSGESFEDYYERVNEAAEHSSELRKKLEADLANSIVGFASVLFENKVQAVEEDIAKSEDYYARQIELAGDDYRKRDILEKEAEKKRQELEKRKRKELKKQFIFNQLLSIAEIGVNLAKTISAINLAGAMIDAITFGVGGKPYIAANLPFAIGTAAVQVATVLAKKAPKYKHGRKGGPAEFAEVGDGFVHEVVEKGDGSAYLTPNRPTLTYLEKDDKVHSSFEDYLMNSQSDYSDLFKTTALANLETQGQKVNDHQRNIVINNRINEEIFKNAILSSGKSIEQNVLKAINKSLLSAKTVNNIIVEQPTEYNKF